MPLQTRINENTDPKPNVSQEVGDEDSLVAPVKVVNNEQLDSYARELSFLAESVEVMILPSQNQDDKTKLVDVSVNGKTYYFLRGEWRKVPRFVLEVLVTSKVEAWNFGYKQSMNGATVQTQDSWHVLRYPHIYRDANPEGVKWYDSIKDRIH